MKTREIAELVGGELRGDAEIEVRSVASLASAGGDQLAFFDGSGEMPASSAAGCVIVSGGVTEATSSPAIIIVRDPKLAFARAAASLHPEKQRSPEIHPSAVIADTAVIGEDVFIGAFVCVGEGSVIGARSQLRAGAKIGDNVRLGTDCVLHPNVFIEDGCTLGSEVTLHAGVVIGADGFGYVRDERGEHVKFPQIGGVVIEDNVEIGANSCVDRGSLGTTRIGRATKIDNLVQVAHNVRIGERCVIASETGISGSSTIGDDCVIGGQVGIADHVRIESGAVIGARSAVFPGKIVRKGVWAGTPVQPIEDYKRERGLIKKLARLAESLRRGGR